MVIIALGAKTLIDNNNAKRAAEEARIEQEEIQKTEIANQHQSLIDDFNNELAEIKRSVTSSSYRPNIKEFESMLIRLEESLTELQRFERSNSSIYNPQHTVLKQRTVDLCDELSLIFLNMATSPSPSIDDSPKWSSMQLNVKSLKDRL